MTLTTEIIDRLQLETTLLDIQCFIRRYVVLSDEQAVAITLWTVHTHAIAASDCTPYLQITSPTKRAGKTRLLEVLEPLVARPWLTGRTSAAALVRKVDAEAPTLLLDESDAAFNGEQEYSEALRGILNTGYRRSGKATLCVGQGAHIGVRDFSTFCPKAIAGIGTLPGTVADRSITIALRRRASTEPCARWCEREGHAEAAPFHQQLATCAKRAIPTLRAARPTLPVTLGDRQADVWEPLLAIADLAGDDWSKRARHAAVRLAGASDDTDIVVELLADICEILKGHHGDTIATSVLLEQLVALEDRPWREWRRGHPLTAHGLARQLGPLGIHPDRHERVRRGYRVDAFEDAISRYLPNLLSQCHNPDAISRYPPNLLSQCHNPHESGPKSAISCVTETAAGDTSKTPKRLDFIEEGTLRHIDPGVTGRDGYERDDDPSKF